MMKEFLQEQLNNTSEIVETIKKHNFNVEYMSYLLTTNKNRGIVMLNEQNFSEMV